MNKTRPALVIEHTIKCYAVISDDNWGEDDIEEVLHCIYDEGETHFEDVELESGKTFSIMHIEDFYDHDIAEVS